MIRSDSLRTPPITPVVASPTRGFAYGHYRNAGEQSSAPRNPGSGVLFADGGIEATTSRLQLTEADKDQPMFQEVDIGEVKSREDRYHRLADKENVPPPSFNQGVKRLAMSHHTNGSNASLYRPSKVSATWNVRPLYGCLCFDLQTYRPPTPPLPSRKRTSAPSTPVTVTMNKPMHIVRILVHRSYYSR